MSEIKESKDSSNIFNILKDKSKTSKIIVVFLVLAFAWTLFNQYQLFDIKGVKAVTGNTQVANGISLAQAAIIPRGMPKLYGNELGVKYDDVSANNPSLADQTITALGNLDRTITLTGKDLERYVDITSQISCEYCCGAKSIIVRREDVANINKQIEAAIQAGKITKEQAEQYRQKAGEAACGCAHSYAMRGLAKYLIKNHNSEFTDDEILEELAKWKTLFFPGQMMAKAEALKQNGIEFSYINLGGNKYRDIEKGAGSGGMVGGC